MTPEKERVFVCETCGETAHWDNADEMVFANGDDIVHSISEQYPDWTHCYCSVCYEKMTEEVYYDFSLSGNSTLTELSLPNYNMMNIDEQREHLILLIQNNETLKAQLIAHGEAHPEDQTVEPRLKTIVDTIQLFEQKLRVIEMG